MNPQNQAADPNSSIGLTANAGSGKTSTLVNRVARLLLSGARPENIVCVTYTKAAAAEMQSRLFERLGGWAVADDQALASDLKSIDEEVRDLALARALFAKALETPGGLKIQTIHAFCEKLLRRFPLEAGLSPSFQVLDDLTQAKLFKSATDQLLLKTGEMQHRDALIRLLKPDAFLQLLQQFSQHGDKINRAIMAHDNWALSLCKSLGMDEIVTPQIVVERFMTSLDWGALKRLGQSLIETKGERNQKTGGKIIAIVDEYHNHNSFDLDAYYKVFFTAEGTFSKHAYSKGISEVDKDLLHRLSEPVLGVIDDKHAAQVAQNTINALLLFKQYSDIYLDLKRQTGALDFQDLIAKSRDLLSDPSKSAWILFKLDGGIDHILVDEAQDTSQDQWEIVKSLSAEFFNDEKGQIRTVFAVGDEKQSIYGFQGARPEKFLEARRDFQTKAILVDHPFLMPSLVKSYRSLPEVLGFVDAVFAKPDLAQALGFDGEVLKHEHSRVNAKGCVELWPLILPIKTEEAEIIDFDDYDPSPEKQGEGAADLRLAKQIAGHIAHEINIGRSVYAKDLETKIEVARPLHAGDVLILCKKRNALFNHIIRELKLAGVPVSGADRLDLNSHIAFEDIRALLRFCAQDKDDLSLACVLRSPFCDIDEQQLYDLCRLKQGQGGLWQALLSHPHDNAAIDSAKTFLGWALKESQNLTAFDFLARTLNRRDNNGLSQRQRFLTRLGTQCEDVLDETLNLAQKAQGAGEISLHAFLNVCEFNSSQIKREQEEGGRRVRVMTIHGSKGLEAPWVIVPIPPVYSGHKEEQLLIHESKDGVSATPPDIYLCPLGKKSDPNAITLIKQERDHDLDAEGLRLFYVALTRARDRLTICGYKGKREKEAKCAFKSWYELAQDAFDHLKDGVNLCDIQHGAHSTQVRLYGEYSPLMTKEAQAQKVLHHLPDFVTALDYPREEANIKWRAISQMGDEDRSGSEQSQSPLATTRGLGLYRRGNLIHKLFEILPDINSSRRECVAKTYLSKQLDLNDEQRAEIVASVMFVLNDARFAEAFGEGSRSEVAISGRIGAGLNRLSLSGRIDRLIISADRIVVIDYKSNRPAPEKAEDAALDYQRQMAGYVALLRQIYPLRRVEAALLWTDGPKLTPFSDALIDLRLAEILSL